MVSKALVVGEYQRKLEAMAAHHDVDLVCVVPPSWKSKGGDLHLEAGHTQGYRLAVQPIRFNGSFHFFHFPTLGRLLRALKPDLVHIDEEPYNLATYLALRNARSVKAKSLFFSWQNLVRRYPPPFSFIEQQVYSGADCAIAGTQDAAEVLRTKGFRKRIEVIPQFGVNTERFRPQPPPPGPPWVIGFLGRIVEEKGVISLIEALAQIEEPWRLELIGSGPYRDELEARAAHLGISDRLEFRAQVPSADVPEALHRLHVLVMPSLTRVNWKEQFGRAIVEAMACGIPVIGSDSGEIPRVIGDAGLTYPEGSVDALAATLRRVLSNESLRADMSRRGQQRVLAHFTQQRVADQTVALYRSIVDGAA